MNINNYNVNSNRTIQTKPAETNKKEKIIKLPSNNTSLNSFYYKDFTINFKGQVKEKKSSMPTTKEEFISSLNKTKKYTDDDINSILEMINTIIDNDQWEETDETLLYEMFSSLASSNKNSDIRKLEKITSKICQLEQDDDYVEINPFLKGISAVCSNINADDYNFERIFSGGLSGILDCENTELVYEYCDSIRDLLKNTDEKKFTEFLSYINAEIAANNENLKNALNAIKVLSEEQDLKQNDLLDGLMLYHSEKADLASIKDKLNIRKSLPNIFSKLNTENVDYHSFEKTFASSIEELLKRGFSAEEIADLLSYDDFFKKIMYIEHIDKTNPVILADFIETIKDSANHYETMYEYTRSSSMFNNLLIQYGNDLSKFPENEIFESDTGYKYTTATSKAVIHELSAFLETQELKRDMIVYRGCGFGILDQKELATGEKAGSALKKALENNDNEKINQIIEELKNSTFIHDNFLSTSFEPSGAKIFIKKEGGILWQINAPKGSHGIYADPFNIENGLEKEILFNKGYSLSVTNAKLEDGIITIYADLV